MPSFCRAAIDNFAVIFLWRSFAASSRLICHVTCSNLLCIPTRVGTRREGGMPPPSKLHNYATVRAKKAPDPFFALTVLIVPQTIV